MEKPGAMTVKAPPIKCQGIKTKLVPFIRKALAWEGRGAWIEPFMGSGVVGFNLRPERARFADTNPHLIAFYRALAKGEVDGSKVRRHLEREGARLYRRGEDHYYAIRKRFNDGHDPLDFLFLNRSCFNGVIRFNRSGGFNVPFNHKPERFAKAYVTRIVNQVNEVRDALAQADWRFTCRDFREVLAETEPDDFVYCDPPYAGRHVDYFDSWDDDHERALFEMLSGLECRFMLSTWHSNRHRKNRYLKELWSRFHVVTREHFYHVGAKETNRNPMLEALVMNFVPGVGQATSKPACADRAQRTP